MTKSDFDTVTDNEWMLVKFHYLGRTQYPILAKRAGNMVLLKGIHYSYKSLDLVNKC